METAEINDQVAIINNSIELFKTAPEILQKNQFRTKQALQVGNNILSQWEYAWQIQDETEKLAALATADERSNNYLVKCNNAVKEQKEVRSSITQMMDAFKKMFTEAENDIDKSKANTIPSKVQTNRDTYARISAEIAERKRKEAERVAAKAKEIIEIKANIETNISNQYNAYLLAKKQAYTNNFNTLTLADFEERSEKLKSLVPKFDMQIQQPSTFWPKYHSEDEVAGFIPNIVSEKIPQYKANFLFELNITIQDLIDKLPSKKAELDEAKRLEDIATENKRLADLAEKERQEKIANANAEQKKKLEEEAAAAKIEQDKKDAELKAQQEKAATEKKQREDEENQRLQQEAAESAQREQQQLEMQKQGEQTMVMFEQEATLAETAAPTAKQGFEIEVLHPVGFTQIFQLWFEQYGKNLPIDKMGNTKLDQMKAWCEKFALDNGTKIESKFLKYSDSFKALNRKK